MLLKDEDTGRELKNILISLDLDEAKELMTSLEDLIKNPEGNHSHVPSRDCSRELTVHIYNSSRASNKAELL